MGIYDREYYRSSRGRFLESFAGTGQVCRWLILINVVVFILQIVTLPRGGRGSLGPITDFFMLDTHLVYHYGQVWRLLTYAFLHSPDVLLHIVFNLLFLWWFGRELEEIYGSREFLFFYLTAALLGGIAFTAYAGYTSWSLNGDPGAETMKCVGASGGVTAVMLLYALHFPHRTILLFFILPIPIWVFVAFQVFQDAFYFLSNAKTTTAVTAHLGGALFGFLYYRFGWRLSSRWGNWKWPAAGRRAKPQLRIYEEKPVEEFAELAQQSADEQLEAKLDAVLEKIQLYGQESLTESERQILVRASEKYKQRRQSTEGV